jgi:hypothetical protein
MASPFPGMDPYIEGQEWEDFHFRFIHALAGGLDPYLPPNYVTRVEKRVYVERPGDEPPAQPRPDVAVIRKTPSVAAGVEDAALSEPPFSIPLLIPIDQEEPYLEIRLRESGELVTSIELLSPSNKRARGDGWHEYLTKREQILRSWTHLVEIDLLRGGQRLPMATSLPPGDYFVMLSRVRRRPMADVWPFTLRDPMPRIPIPLSKPDADIPLDLQSAFEEVYRMGRYESSLDYAHGAVPPLSAEEQVWADELLALREG